MKLFIQSIQQKILAHKVDTRNLEHSEVQENRLHKAAFFMLIINGSYFLVLIGMVLYKDGILSQAVFVNLIVFYCLLCVILGIIFLPYYPKHYGFNLNRLRYNLVWGGGGGLLLALAAIVIRYSLVEMGYWRFGFDSRWKWVVLFYPASVFAQEGLVRGLLQSFFVALFAKTRHPKWIAIFFASLIFALFHLMFGFLVCALAFCFSLFVGNFYEKSRSLVGVFLLHFWPGLAMFYFSYL